MQGNIESGPLNVTSCPRVVLNITKQTRRITRLQHAPKSTIVIALGLQDPECPLGRWYQHWFETLAHRNQACKTIVTGDYAALGLSPGLSPRHARLSQLHVTQSQPRGWAVLRQVAWTGGDVLGFRR